MRITKAKATKYFKAADQLLGEVKNIIRLKVHCNKQLLALQKRSYKSQRYRKRSHSKNSSENVRHVAVVPGRERNVMKFLITGSSGTSTSTCPDGNENINKSVSTILGVPCDESTTEIICTEVQAGKAEVL